MDLETRELRYFVTVAEELHFGRAAERLGMAQPPLSRAIQRLERRLGAVLLERDRRGVALTPAGEVLLREGRVVLDAATAAANRVRRAGGRIVLAVKAGADHELLSRVLPAYREEVGAGEVEVLLCGIGEQAGLLRAGRADAALVHRPFDDVAGFDTEELLVEEQVAVLPARHPLARRESLTMSEIADVPGLPLARWPRLEGGYPPGPGPEVRDQAQVSQLIALGLALLVIPASSRAWQWAEHAGVPVVDAPPVTTLIAWQPHSRSPALAGLVRAAVRVGEEMGFGSRGRPAVVAGSIK
ncbi:MULTISPECIES: LysR family transcriptional regulator [Actinosynnema]|uniref:LysR family transcriptional regulator n=1 Tax=Actinosynnema pretiosum TaxID=42197 RepID=A0A290ZB00_9PSEU|nr:LysR family transcriptional regulator [Actinosynnema pretiosum]ATE56211.1 LysR family transcriptional regulator [Actinosynnema pretiosum]